MTCLVKPIRYGTVNFENVFLNSKTSSTPMYADDGVSVKYIKTRIEIEFVHAVDNASTDAFGVNSADNYLDQIKGTLTTPGLPFEYSYRGFSKKFETTGNDVIYGPYPEVLDWEPLGSNKAVRVRWAVTVHTRKCFLSTAPSVDSPLRFEIIQLTEDSSLSFNDSGAVVIQTNGTLEVAQDSAGFLTRQNLKLFSRFFLPNRLPSFKRDKIQLNLRKDHRTIDFRITDTEIESDNPLFRYMVAMDVSHDVSSKLLGGSWKSGSGFRSWVNTLDGTFKVRPGLWKGWAWIAFLHVMAQRRSRANSDNVSGVKAAFDNNADPTTGNDDNPDRKDRKQIRAKQVPLSLKISENIYGRGVSINSQWITVCSIFDLFRSTGLFYPVDVAFTDSSGTAAIHPATIPDLYAEEDPDVADTVANQWSFWSASMSTVQNSFGYRGASLPGFNLVFDLCNRGTNQLNSSNQHLNQYLGQDPIPEFDSGWDYYEEDDSYNRTTFGKLDSKKPLPNDGKTTSKYLDGVPPGASHVEFKNGFEMIEETNASYIPTLCHYTPEGSSSHLLATEGIHAEATYRDEKGFRINGAKYPAPTEPYNNEIIAVHGKPVYKVKMTGHAIRIGWQIPMPVLMGVSKNAGPSSELIPAYRIGQQRWKTGPLNVSDEIPVYYAAWEQMYAIPMNPQSDNIKYETSGNPAEFA